MCHGGLGIKKMMIFNQALLGKWLWCYEIEVTSLRRQFIKSKYGVNGGGTSVQVRRGDQMGWGCGSILGVVGII